MCAFLFPNVTFEEWDDKACDFLGEDVPESHPLGMSLWGGYIGDPYIASYSSVLYSVL
jgi:hypothetical protein